MSTVHFISHPNVKIEPSVPVTEWSLSEVGSGRMHKMLSLDWVNTIESIFCSTENKAIDGARILAGHLDLPFKKLASLGENDRSSTGYLASEEFETVADQFFASPSQSIRGWETANDAQARIVKAVGDIVKTVKVQGPIAIVSHGAVGTLLLCHLRGWGISREHDQPGDGGGNYFSFEQDTFLVNHGWMAIDD